MKMLGLIGGVGPESTIDYYQRIIALYRERVEERNYPHFLVDSIDLQCMVDWINAGQLSEIADYLLTAVQRLERAGAQFAAVAANTPHVVFDDLQPRSPLPLVSIVEATCEAARAASRRRLGLFGTRFTMQGRFYPEVFTRAGIDLVVPTPAEQEWIHAKYMGELVKGVFLDGTRSRLLEVVERMRRESAIDGLILGGTELPLILRGVDVAGLPFLDTTAIHVQAIVDRMLG